MDKPASPSAILVQGRNCWRQARANQIAFLVDAKAYFEALRLAFGQARRRIWIVGWDFDPDIRLCPDQMGEPTLGELLRELVETNDALEVRILIWAMGPLYSSRSANLYATPKWADHPRISLKFDARHPFRASHHQKIVVVDEALSFSGGMDLTNGRWDTPDHPASSSLRVTPQGKHYGPVHDVQIAVSGSAARALADVAMRRWFAAGGRRVSGLRAHASDDPWPERLAVDLADCDIAVARTEGGFFLRRGKREAIRLTLDLIESARKTLYIETQYLASWRIARAIKRKLEEPNGPEIFILVTKGSRGVVEQYVMAQQRDRILRWLGGARGPRLRVAYRVKHEGDRTGPEVLVHSKVIVADDTAVRIGSSNLNNRSEGLDTECDVVIVASSEQHREKIAAFRDSLVAEHLECAPERLASTVRDKGSWLSAIDSLAERSGTLLSYDEVRENQTPLLGTWLLDPSRPIRPFAWLLRRLIGSRRIAPTPEQLGGREGHKAEH